MKKEQLPTDENKVIEKNSDKGNSEPDINNVVGEIADADNDNTAQTQTEQMEQRQPEQQQTEQPQMEQASLKNQAENIFKKNERLFALINLGLGVATLVILLIILMLGSSSANINSLDAIDSAISSIRFALNLAIILLIVSIAAVIVNVGDIIFYPAKKKNLDTLVMLGGQVVLTIGLLALLPTISSLASALKELAGGSFSALMSLASINTDALSWAKPIGWLSGLAILAGVVLKCLAIFQNKYFPISKTIEDVTSSKAAAMTNQLGGQLSEQLGEQKEKVIKNKKVILIIATIAVVVGSIGGYFAFFHKTKVDVMEGISIDYVGVSGNGTASIDKSGIQTTDKAEINSFISSVYYSLSKSEGLANGDTITITAQPNAETMKKLKLSVPTLTKEFVVDGLQIVPEKVSDIPNVEALYERIDRVIYAEFVDQNNYTYTVEDLGVYYGTAPTSASAYGTVRYGTVYKMYKVTSNYSSTWYSNTSEGYYIYGITNLVLNADGTLDEDAYKTAGYFSKYSDYSSEEKALIYLEELLPKVAKVEN